MYTSGVDLGLLGVVSAGWTVVVVVVLCTISSAVYGDVYIFKSLIRVGERMYTMYTKYTILSSSPTRPSRVRVPIKRMCTSTNNSHKIFANLHCIPTILEQYWSLVVAAIPPPNRNKR